MIVQLKGGKAPQKEPRTVFEKGLILGGIEL